MQTVSTEIQSLIQETNIRTTDATKQGEITTEPSEEKRKLLPTCSGKIGTVQRSGQWGVWCQGDLHSRDGREGMGFAAPVGSGVSLGLDRDT